MLKIVKTAITRFIRIDLTNLTEDAGLTMDGRDGNGLPSRKNARGYLT